MPKIASVRALLATLFLAAFGYGLAAAGVVPLPHPRPSAPLAWAVPQSFRDAAGADFNSAAVTSAPSDCRKRLDTIAVIEPMPRLIGPGACGGGDMVQINAVQLAGHVAHRNPAGAGAAL